MSTVSLSELLGSAVYDSTGSVSGRVREVALAPQEDRSRVATLIVKTKTGNRVLPFASVGSINGGVYATTAATSWIAADAAEGLFLLERDLLDQQIIDVHGRKVVRVNDLKLSDSRNQLRLLGAEVGVRGILRGISPGVENFVLRLAQMFKSDISENIIAWNYMDLLDRDLSQVKLSVTHKRLHELHPADVADILEQLTPSQRARVFEHLDNDQAAEAIQTRLAQIQESVG